MGASCISHPCSSSSSRSPPLVLPQPLGACVRVDVNTKFIDCCPAAAAAATSSVEAAQDTAGPIPLRMVRYSCLRLVFFRLLLRFYYYGEMITAASAAPCPAGMQTEIRPSGVIQNWKIATLGFVCNLGVMRSSIECNSVDEKFKYILLK